MAREVLKTAPTSQQGQKLPAVPRWPLLTFILQFFDRLKLFWMPAKHQPDFIYLRHVPLRKVHLFTVIQLICLVLLWAIKVSRAAIIFPMMVRASAAWQRDVCSAGGRCSLISGLTASSLFLVKVLALVFVRKVMDFCFSKRELSFLDDLMPEGKFLDGAKNEAEGEEASSFWI
ncbi:sodium-driven chloride bicarbonate exchanger-like [Strix uralensis]|uniref:sodium-driven chloride bicarbonate exchanger-like n=1 Tax=Strix uralensis TaxID=36305 RepID=UPI003DA74B95